MGNTNWTGASDMRVGILGGTFDPIHTGHLLIAESARQHLGLDRVIFIPAGQPWMKEYLPISDAHHRIEMARLATEDNLRFVVSDAEVLRDGPTYTVETLAELRDRLLPDTEVFLILGSDAINELPRWKEAEQIKRFAKVAVVARPDADEINLAAERIAGGLIWVESPGVNISSSDIREMVARDQSILYIVPRPVRDYIDRHGLYRGENER